MKIKCNNCQTDIKTARYDGTNHKAYCSIACIKSKLLQEVYEAYLAPLEVSQNFNWIDWGNRVKHVLKQS